MDAITLIAEHRIKEAMQRGDFDNLALRGQPLPAEDLSAIPAELQMGYKVLKNAGYLPEELQMQQEILSLHELLSICDDPQQAVAAKRKLSLRQLQFDMLMEKRGRSLAWQHYEEKLAARLTKQD